MRTRQTIEAYLDAGTTVICDRYAFSGIAFSASKLDAKGEPLLSYEWCKNPEIGLPCPDLVLFFDITPEKARERGGYGGERYEKEDMQRRVRQIFVKIGAELEGRWKVVDAGQDVAVVSEQVWSIVRPLVTEGVPAPLEKLWT